MPITSISRQVNEDLSVYFRLTLHLNQNVLNETLLTLHKTDMKVYTTPCLRLRLTTNFHAIRAGRSLINNYVVMHNKVYRDIEPVSLCLVGMVIHTDCKM